jgi:hypothetical protein
MTVRNAQGREVEQRRELGERRIRSRRKRKKENEKKETLLDHLVNKYFFPFCGLNIQKLQNVG